jgi:ferredoxin
VDSPYDVLGVAPDADESELVDAYRRRVKEAHPDHGGSTAEFRAVREAYETARARLDGDVEESATDDGAEEAEAAATPAADPRETGARVEYLNYEALDDRGWDLGDDDLFEKAARADLGASDYGEFRVNWGEYILEAAEERGFAWPYACRGGACANCAVAVVEGEVEMPSNHVLSESMLDSGIRLSCISTPLTEELRLIYNVKHLPGLDELRLPASRFDRARATE